MPVVPRAYRKGSEHPQWKGGMAVINGYIAIKQPNHPRAHQPNGHVYEHILVAEHALGHFLPLHALVHHVNQDPRDNRPCNLVICEDQAYHMLLHKRLRGYLANGNPDSRKCTYCKQYDTPKNLAFVRNGTICHRSCRQRYQQDYQLKVKASYAV